eukprot:3502279-Rhodomonas_salina.1
MCLRACYAICLRACNATLYARDLLCTYACAICATLCGYARDLLCTYAPTPQSVSARAQRCTDLLCGAAGTDLGYVTTRKKELDFARGRMEIQAGREGGGGAAGAKKSPRKEKEKKKSPRKEQKEATVDAQKPAAGSTFATVLRACYAMSGSDLVCVLCGVR